MWIQSRDGSFIVPHRLREVWLAFGHRNEPQKENFVIVYELLDEVLDAGFPLATEPNILKELIKPSSIMRSITNTVTGKSNVSESLPSGQLSNVPWRRAGVKYSNNEAFFDIKEDVSLFPSGNTRNNEFLAQPIA